MMCRYVHALVLVLCQFFLRSVVSVALDPFDSCLFACDFCLVLHAVFARTAAKLKRGRLRQSLRLSGILSAIQTTQ